MIYAIRSTIEAIPTVDKAGVVTDYEVVTSSGKKVKVPTAVFESFFTPLYESSPAPPKPEPSKGRK